MNAGEASAIVANPDRLTRRKRRRVSNHSDFAASREVGRSVLCCSCYEIINFTSCTIKPYFQVTIWLK